MEYNIIYENGKMLCKNCKFELNEKNQCHECYIQKTELKEKSELYIFSDFECLTNENKNHQVNLSVSMYFDNDIPIIHKNIYDYVKWLLDPKHKKYTVIFHNGSGYDFNFIVKELLNNNIFPKIIMDGTRLKYMIIQKLKMRFIDSFLFTISPLKNFTKMFDLNNKDIIKNINLMINHI